MRASGGVYLTSAPRLSSTVRSVAIMLASANTQTMALCCVSWIFFFTRCQSYCPAHMYAQPVTLQGFLHCCRAINHTTQLTKSIYKWTDNEDPESRNHSHFIHYFGLIFVSMRHNQSRPSVYFSFIIFLFSPNSPSLHFCGTVLEICHVNTVSSGLSQWDIEHVPASFQEKKHGTVVYIIQKGLKAHWNGLDLA